VGPLSAVAGRALLLLAGCAAALALGEALVRLLGVGTATLSRGSLHAFHPEFGWICLPGLDARYVSPGNFDARIVCNRLGQRGPEIPVERSVGRLRVAVLGDSFMWGFGVENHEVLSSHLERLLPWSETLNLAANGYGTVQQLLRLEREGLAYAPDWTLLSFTPNDLGDNFDDKGGGRPIVAVASDGSFAIENSPVRRPWKHSGTQSLRQQSRLLAFFDYARQIVRYQLRVWRRSLAFRDPSERRLRRWEERELEPLDFSPRELYGEPSPEIDLAWRAFEHLLGRIDALARRSGGRLLVFANANSEVMRRDAFTARYGDGPELDWDRPAERLAQICRRLHLECLDLNPVFRREPDPDALFFPRDSHWSPRGHELAARAVAERLRELSAASR
jgi:lysophospholipase L1-like esterase